MSNSWKKWMGVVQGFERFSSIEKKEALEEQFRLWLSVNPDYMKRYGQLLPEFSEIYQKLEPYYIVNDFGSEAIFHVEVLNFASGFTELLNLDPDHQDDEFRNTLNKLTNRTENFFRNYEVEIDRDVFSKVLELYYKNVGQQFHPDLYQTIHHKYKGNYHKFIRHVMKKTLFTDKSKILDMLNHYSFSSAKKIISDPVFQIFISFGEVFRNNVYPQYNQLTNQLETLYPEYLDALMLMQPDRLFYPDANFTMRLTYGKVEGYSPADAIRYHYLSSLRGVMEKENPEVNDYIVPEKLKRLFEEKDFGPYGVNGRMPLCFVASNHTSGGNSGSPVLDANGYLIGINFDRNWEGTMNDFMYNPDICRNISLDIRYVLFIIEKYAGAHHIIDELTIVD